MPRCEGFVPTGAADNSRSVTVMTLDEFETVRLIDLEGMTQEQCAAQMDVARTTVQSIYNCARKKLALCLVYGSELRISGGDYIVCEEKMSCRACQCRGGCRKNKLEDL